MLDHVRSQVLRSPSPWELQLWRGARGGHERESVERAFDRAISLQHDDATLRTSEQLERRQCSPVAGAFGAGALRPNVFRALFMPHANGHDVWVDADHYYDDGAQRVYAWRDYCDATHYFEQATFANQVLLPSANATLSGAKGASYTSASHTYQSTRPVSQWKWIHDKTPGSEVVHVMIPAAIAVNVGYAIYWSTGTSNGQCLGLRDASYNLTLYGGAVTKDRCTSTVTLGDLTVLRWSHQSSGFELRMNYGTAETGLTKADANTPNWPMYIGGTGGNQTAPCVFRAWYAFRRVLTIPERVIRNAWVQRETGINIVAA